MKADEDFWETQREISFEWSRYVLNNPRILDNIPEDAQIGFLLDDNPVFNRWSIEMNKRQREAGHKVVFIRIKKLLPTRMVGPHLEPAVDRV